MTLEEMWEACLKQQDACDKAAGETEEWLYCVMGAVYQGSVLATEICRRLERIAEALEQRDE